MPLVSLPLKQKRNTIKGDPAGGEQRGGRDKQRCMAISSKQVKAQTRTWGRVPGGFGLTRQNVDVSSFDAHHESFPDRSVTLFSDEEFERGMQVRGQRRCHASGQDVSEDGR